jgi:hypothetical protein
VILVNYGKKSRKFGVFIDQIKQQRRQEIEAADGVARRLYR